MLKALAAKFDGMASNPIALPVPIDEATMLNEGDMLVYRTNSSHEIFDHDG